MKSAIMVLMMLPLVCLVVSVFVSNEQVSLQGIDLRLPTKAYTARPLLVALQYRIYRFTSNDLFLCD